MRDLIPLLLQNVALLAFAAVFAPLLTGYRRPLRGIVKGLVLGLLFGLACLLVTAFPVISPDGAALDARAGPILFAGFLYGPIAGLIAAAIGSIGRVLTGGPFVFSGVIIFYVYGVLGVLLARLLRRPSESAVIRPLDVLLLYIASMVAVANMYWLIAPVERANLWLVQDLPLIALMNGLSTVVLGLMLRVVLDVVRDRDRASRLAERLELATTSAGIGIWDYDIVGNSVIWDAQQCRLHGLEPGSFAGTYTAWLATVHPDDRAAAVAAARQALEGTAPFDTEFRVVTPSGDERVLKGAAVVLRDGAGRPARMVGVNFDLTALRHTEREAARRQDLLDDIATTIPGALFRYSEHPENGMRIAYMSKGCADIWEIDPVELQGDPGPLWATVVDEYLEPMRASIAASAEAMTPWYFAWEIVTSSGKRKALEGRGWPRRLDTGATEWSTIVVDVTAQRETEKALERSHKVNSELQKFEAIGKLTGGVAHDFNNLLAVILGNLELNQTEDLTPAARAGLEDAIAACKRGATLTSQLLAFGRRAILRPEPVNLNSVLAQITALIGRTFRENISVEIVQAGGLWNTMLDRTAFDSAVLNTAINARDAMPNGGKLTFETANVRLGDEYLAERGETVTQGRYVMVAITDTGSGIDPVHLPHVFEPFYTTKRVGEGSGMGLAMLHGFVNQSNGLVRIYSEPGVGTTVKMYFPATEEAESFTIAAEPSKIQGGRERILLVEDEALVRRTISRQLITIGYDVVTAENGRTALEVFEAEKPFDLLVTDIVMPGLIQGPALAQRIRALQPGIPVIFISGYPNEAAIHGNGLTHRDRQLMKPVSLDTLARTIRRVFDSDA